MPFKKKIFVFISLLYILYTVVPIVVDITGIPVWVVNLFTFVVLFVLYPRAFKNPVTYWFLAYATVLAVYVVVGKPLTIGIGTVHDSKKIIIEYAFFLPSLSMFSILYYLKDYRLMKIISLGALFLIIFSFLYIIPMVLSQGTILRDAVYLAGLEKIHIPGIPNYALVHAYIIIIPALLYGLKTYKSPQKWGVLVFLFMFIYIIIHSYVTTSIVITFAVIVFSLLFKTENKVTSYVLILLLFFVIYILHVTGIFVNFFNLLIDFFDGTEVQPKIEGFKYIYLYGDIDNSGGSITGRLSLHDMSWKAFFENFLIGGSSPVGGHSGLLDRLGGMGVIAFIPFVMIILKQAQMCLNLIKNEEARVYYFLGLFASLTLLYTKGLFGQEGWLFLMVLLPGLIVTIWDSKKTDLMKKVIGYRKS